MHSVKRIAQELRSSAVLRGSAAALAIKFTGSALGFAMFALSARYMEPGAFGSLALIFNAMSFLAVIAVCGQETLIVRSWDEYRVSDRPALARGALLFGALIVLAAALLTSAIAGFAWAAWDRQVSRALLTAACAFLFAQSLMHFSAQFSRVAGGVLIGEFPREIGWRLMVVLTILIHHFWQGDFSAVDFFYAAAGALIISVVLQGWRVSRILPKAVTRTKPEGDLAVWMPRSFRMWLSALLETSSQYLEVLVIGFFLGSRAAGFFFVATRITNVFAMIAGSIAAYATSQISSRFYSNAREELQNILSLLALISAGLACGAFLVILFAGKLLLSIFGAVYVVIYTELVVLALGASIGALTGPAGYLLLLTGNEAAYPRIMACGMLLRFILIACLAPLLGVMGAVIACSVSALGLGAALVITCRRLVHLDPSIISAFWRKPPRVARLKGGLL